MEDCLARGNTGNAHTRPLPILTLQTEPSYLRGSVTYVDVWNLTTGAQPMFHFLYDENSHLHNPVRLHNVSVWRENHSISDLVSKGTSGTAATMEYDNLLVSNACCEYTTCKKTVERELENEVNILQYHHSPFLSSAQQNSMAYPGWAVL